MPPAACWSVGSYRGRAKESVWSSCKRFGLCLTGKGIREVGRAFQAEGTAVKGLELETYAAYFGNHMQLVLKLELLRWE